MRQRRQELKDAQSIRQNYEEKLHRVNQLCSHLKALTEELEREQQRVTQYVKHPINYDFVPWEGSGLNIGVAPHFCI